MKAGRLSADQEASCHVTAPLFCPAVPCCRCSAWVLQLRRDPAQPELKFQKKWEETKKPLIVFQRYIVLPVPACLFD